MKTDKNPIVEGIEIVEEATVELVKAPFKVVGGIFDWLSGND